MSEADVLGALERIGSINAERVGLRWSEDGKRVMELAKEQDVARAALRDATSTEVRPLFYSVDDGELAGLYALGDADPAGFAIAALDQIADHACTDTAVPIGQHGQVNWLLLTSVLGVASVAPAMAVLRAAIARCWREHVRFDLVVDELDEDEEPTGECTRKIGPIDSDDSAFEEVGFRTCEPTDEHAMLITRVEIDRDLMEELCALVELRALAAKRALRGESVDA